MKRNFKNKPFLFKPCRLSPEAREKWPRNTEQTGIIVGESRDKRCWKILWKGHKFKDNYHKDFIEIIELTPPPLLD